MQVTKNGDDNILAYKNSGASITDNDGVPTDRALIGDHKFIIVANIDDAILYADQSGSLTKMSEEFTVTIKDPCLRS